MNKKFVIYTNGYNDNIGGIVVLHQLCDLLNKRGEQAYIWNRYRPLFNFKQPLRSLYLFFKYYKKMMKHGYNMNPRLKTPLATKADLEDAIVIYPEIVEGNPLQGKNVVRWLLHKPGFNSSGKIDFGKNDLFFYYLKAYDDSRFNKFPDNYLHIENIRRDTYTQTNFAERKGSCYIVRKAKNPQFIHDLSDSIQIDGLSHQEMAEVFNKVKYCIAYDPYTMFSVYAVMCGCISIIVPESGVTKEQWQPSEEDRYGLAYGFDDVEYALATKEKLLYRLEQKEIESNILVDEFVSKCKNYFDAKNEKNH